MDFEELKQNAKKELEDAIQKQEELIKTLQRSFSRYTSLYIVSKI